MRTRISVALNGTELHSIDQAIVLQGVDEGAASWNITTGSRAGNSGQHVNGIEKRTRDVVVNFAVNEMRDLTRRAYILQQVCAWAANGGDLTVSYRDRQMLRVRCAALPAVKSLDKWAETYSITFRAYEVPFWQSMDPESVAISAATSGSATLMVKESAGGKLCFTAANNSGNTVNALAAATASAAIGFQNLGLLSGEMLILDYDKNDVQRIRILNGSTYRSALDKRTAVSADDLILKFGANSLSVESTYAVAWNLYTYGRWE